MPYMQPQDIRDWKPFPSPQDGLDPLERARQRVSAHGQWHRRQNMGRRWTIGCVALEITQRCNLDCTLCYLSESSEALKDIPIEEVFRRVDMILDHYGPGTDVQVTGGDPTLRKREELIEIVRYIESKGLRSSLFTNGILAKRELLQDLAAVGLTDVAFHVDMTQERKGYDSEAALNAIREEYIARARGLPIRCFFNTTVFDGNFHEIPALARFFTQHADVVKLASFQLQADTGRGVLHERGYTIDPQTVQAQIEDGIGRRLNFDAGNAGHRDCNRHAITVVADGRVHDLLGDPEMIEDLLVATPHIHMDRGNKRHAVMQLISYLLRNPAMLLRVSRHAARLLWALRRDALRARGRVFQQAFFIHNFMDAQHLECDRVGACSFMVATPDGPMSMCVHNAKRDDYLVRAIPVQKESKLMYFNPATGQLQDEKPDRVEVRLTRKNARGRAKEALEAERARQRAAQKETA